MSGSKLSKFTHSETGLIRYISCQSLDPFLSGVLGNISNWLLLPLRRTRESENKLPSVIFAHFHPAYISTTNHFKKTTGCHCMCLSEEMLAMGHSKPAHYHLHLCVLGFLLIPILNLLLNTCIMPGIK